MLSRATHFTTMLLFPGIFRPEVRLHFSHIYPGGVGLPQQGHYEHIGTHRDGPLYHAIYTQRTCCERINSQVQALGIENPKVRNGRSVTNLNTLIYVIMNVRAMERAKSINKGLLQIK